MNKIPHKILLLLSSLFFLSSLSNKLLFNELDLITKIDCTVDDSDVHTAVDLWISDQATAEATYGHISTWDTSCVTNMFELFKDSTEFNDDISNWDTSGVTNMQAMFQNAISFNQDIGNWDVSSVTNMYVMFYLASSFNQPIGDWDV